MNKIKFTFLALLITLNCFSQWELKDAVEFQGREGLPNFFNKIQNDDPINIGFIGGSITKADGWRSKTVNWIEDHFQIDDLFSYNAAISGTNSKYGVFRIDEDLLNKSNFDLIFIEFAVNDGGGTSSDVEKSMEGMVRKIWNKNPYTDICFVYKASESFLQDYENGKMNLSATKHDSIASYYNIPSIYLTEETFNQTQSDAAVWFDPDYNRNTGLDDAGRHVFTFDNLHPTDFGHEVYHSVVRRSMLSIQNNAEALSHNINSPIYNDNYENARKINGIPEQSNNYQILTTAGEVSYLDNFINEYTNVFVSKDISSRYTFTFIGDEVGLNVIFGPSAARYIIEVDGVVRNFRNFDGHSTSYRYQSPFIKLSEFKEHTVSIYPSEEPFTLEEKRDLLNSDAGKEKLDNNPEQYQLNELIFSDLFINGDLTNIPLTENKKPGADYCGPYIPSVPLVLREVNDTVISGLDISNPDGHCIFISSSSNVTIKNCRLRNATGNGVEIFNSHNVTIINCRIDSVATGVYAVQSSSIKVLNNSCKNVIGPSNPRGQLAQFNNVSGGGNRINYNILENIAGESDPEDAINIFQSNGLASDPIQIKGNWIRGGGPSSSGGGILAADAGGSYVVIEDNILVDPGQYGLAIVGGNNIQIKNNLVYGKQQSFTNVGLYVWNQYDPVCTDHTVSGNRVKWTNRDGNNNNVWNAGNCGEVIGWETNEWGADIDASILPEVLIETCEADEPDEPSCDNSVDFIEAECFDNNFGVGKEDSEEGGENIAFIEDGDWTSYRNIDLTGMNAVDFRIATPKNGASIEIRLDLIDGPIIAEIPFTNTGGWQTWETVSSTITETAGTHDIYLLFKGEAGGLGNVNWFGFSSNPILGVNNNSENNNLTISLYPNPVEDVLQVKLQTLSNSLASIKVVNSLGMQQDVNIQEVAKNEYSISAEQLTSGAYFIIVNDGLHQTTKSFMMK